MLRLHVHIEAVLVACHIVAMLTLLRWQSAALEAQVSPQILFVRVGLVAARTNVLRAGQQWRLRGMLQRCGNIVQRCNRLHSQRPGVLYNRITEKENRLIVVSKALKRKQTKTKTNETVDRNEVDDMRVFS